MALTKAHNRMIADSPVNIKDFGAVGDGTTDDTAAIQSAIDSLTTGSSLYIPQGEYKLTNHISIENLTNVVIDGEGVLLTEDIPIVSPKKNKITVSGCTGVVVRGITIEGNITTTDIAAGDDVAQILFSQDCEDCHLTYCTIRPVAGGQLCHGVGFYSNNGSINHCTISDGAEFGIILIRDRDLEGSLECSNNTVTAFNKNFEPAYHTSNIYIHHNTSINPDDAHFTVWAKDTATSTINDITIENNKCIGGGNGLWLKLGEGVNNTAASIYNVIFSNNTFNGLSNSLISISNPSNGDIYNIDVKNNKVYNYSGSTLPLLQSAGSLTFNVHDIVITNNHIECDAYQDQVLNMYTSGSGTFSNITVEHNYLSKIGTASTTELFAFKETTNLEFNYNTLNDKGAHTYNDLKWYSNSSGVSIVGNKGLESFDGSYSELVAFRANRDLPAITKGTCTIPSGSTVVYPTHSMSLDKMSLVGSTLYNLQVTPTNNFTTDSHWWITGVWGTYFGVNTDTDPGVSGADFTWVLDLEI
jgi:hypothetical protein